MSASVSAIPAGPNRDYLRVVWLTVALFLSYLCVGMALPVTSIYVTQQLGYGNALAGLAVGVGFVSTILTRGYSGRIADKLGGKTATLRGLVMYVVAGAVCAAASWPGLPAPVAYGIFIVGRLLLGLGESLALVGVVAWGFGIMGPHGSGKVLALVGMGMYGAYAAGSPIGLALLDRTGVSGVMIACTLVPLIGLAMVLPLAAVAPHVGAREKFWRIIGRIWEPGLVVSAQGVGFAAIGAFMPLLFISNGWAHAGLGLSCFGGAFVLARILFGHMPDKVGAIPTALVSMAVAAAGQYLLWTAVVPEMALAGACLTGLGCSLVFPAMGLEVVRRIPPHLRGTAMGGLAAFQDLAYGGTGPVTGLLADRFGYSVVFLVGGVAVTLGLLLVIIIARKDQAPAA